MVMKNAKAIEKIEKIFNHSTIRETLAVINARSENAPGVVHQSETDGITRSVRPIRSSLLIISFSIFRPATPLFLKLSVNPMDLRAHNALAIALQSNALTVKTKYELAGPRSGI